MKAGSIDGALVAEPLGLGLSSRLTYARDLREGDSIRYEFRDEPGSTLVHPTIGRRVYPIEPGGVASKVLELGGGGIAPEPAALAPTAARSLARPGPSPATGTRSSRRSAAARPRSS